MTFSRACLLTCLLIAAGCHKTVPANPPVPQVAAPAAPTPLTKTVTMVCRDSRTGASVECGTPNAVMVGTKAQ